MRKTIAILLLLLLLLAGCTNNEQPQTPPESEPQQKTETITLYYGDENNEQLVTEEQEITYLEGEDFYKTALEALIDGPHNENYTDNIPSGTAVYGTIRQDDALLVNFTHHFTSFGGSVAEIVAVASVVNTLTDFEGIERVKILVEGNELIGPSGEPRGFISRFTMEEGLPEEVGEVILYFSKPDATGVVAEERTINFPAEADLAQRLNITLQELISGPNQDTLGATIPREVRVLSLVVQDGVAIVDFSEEMHTQHPGGAAGESITITSIVNTLTEFEGVDLVAMTVEGEPLNLEHIILDAPVERNEDMIDEPLG